MKLSGEFYGIKIYVSEPNEMVMDQQSFNALLHFIESIVPMVKVSCPVCTGDGIGADESGWVKCPSCGGTGSVVVDDGKGKK